MEPCVSVGGATVWRPHAVTHCCHGVSPEYKSAKQLSDRWVAAERLQYFSAFLRKHLIQLAKMTEHKYFSRLMEKSEHCLRLIFVYVIEI